MWTQCSLSVINKSSRPIERGTVSVLPPCQIVPTCGVVRSGLRCDIFQCCTDVPARVTETWYDCCETPYSHVVFTIHLRRKPLHYVVELIVPCLFFCVVTLISHMLQPGCSDRLSLGYYHRN